MIKLVCCAIGLVVFLIITSPAFQALVIVLLTLAVLILVIAVGIMAVGRFLASRPDSAVETKAIDLSKIDDSVLAEHTHALNEPLGPSPKTAWTNPPTDPRQRTMHPPLPSKEPQWPPFVCPSRGETKWQDRVAPYGYGIPSTTNLGVNVRSQAEKRIGDYFEAQGIQYEYETVLRESDGFFEKQVSKPDFYLPEHGVYVEYWGMLGVQDVAKRQEYERSMRYKMARYHKLGIKFISIYPGNMQNLDWVFRMKFRKAAGYDLRPASRRWS